MADEPKVDPSNDEKIPHVDLILADLRNSAKWREIDSEIIRRRLGERKRKRTKPYPNAPNSIVPIVDDTVREKTNQEMNMIHGAPTYVHIIPLDEKMPTDVQQKLRIAFDTYLRHILKAPAKIEEADDTKNARGMAVVKLMRTKDPRYGTLSDFDPVDPRDIIVPTGTKAMQKARRITQVFRYDPDELLAMAKDNPKWKHVTEIIDAAKKDDRGGRGGDENVTDSLEETKGLVGIATSGKGTSTVIIWEHFTYATDWDVKRDRTRRVKLGEKCKILFSPDAPSLLMDIQPWREKDTAELLGQTELVREISIAAEQKRKPKAYVVIPGKERPWPYIQCRYENRSRYYYATRGIGHLCMDNQIIATGVQNAKMTVYDYTQLPMFTGTGSRPSTNVSHEPGSYLPGDQQPVALPTIPQQFDFDIENNKRAAARRVGALSQYEGSGDLSQKKRVQKTATEVQEESTHSAMISSSDTDRFNQPWGELYQQIYEDLKRMKKELPMIQNHKMQGMAGPEIYEWPVLIVPASSAKTFDPDRQFIRTRSAIEFLISTFGQLGVVFDPETMAHDALSYWDPFMADRWLKKANEEGPGGQPPVYKMLDELAKGQQAAQEILKELSGATQQIGKLATDNSARLDQDDEKERQEKMRQQAQQGGVRV